jgi:glutamate-1-semialdehyde 2,1-aminomutase
MDTKAGQELYNRAKKRIPGGTQLLSKRPEMFLPDRWPNYYTKAQGVKVWDTDGNEFIDMSYCAIGACILGCADPDVNQAVKQAIDAGSMSTLNCPEEVELAELLCELHPWSDMVRYSRSGGESLAIAVRIARAHTKRDKVAFCGYHGWHDWYLSANLAEDDILDGHLLPGLDPVGVPRGLRGTALPFRYNQIEELHTIISSYGDELAAIVMEPLRGQRPDPGFLEEIREIADQIGLVLIFDEVTSGWRMNTGGIHMTLDVQPDIAVFAKAISNGFPMGAIIGRGEIMGAAQDSFISSTAWTERVGSVAALATIRKHKEYDVPVHLNDIGHSVMQVWEEAKENTGLRIAVNGIPPLGHFEFDGYDNSLGLQTLFTQLMLDRGFLANRSFYATYAHQREHVDQYAEALNECFTQIARAIERNEVESLLKGPVAHSGFSRLT